MTTNPCTPHPTTKICTLTGRHLEGCWDHAVCHGCLPCITHNPATPRPVQRPAATTDARKRQEGRP